MTNCEHKKSDTMCDGHYRCLPACEGFGRFCCSCHDLVHAEKHRREYLHVYPQMACHTEVFIVGNTKTLKALRDAIDKVLADGEPKMFDSSVCDGEYFSTIIARLDDDQQWANMAVPYTEEWCQERRENAVSPYDLPGIKKLFHERKK